MRLFDPFLYEKVHLLIMLAFTIYYFYYIQGRGGVKFLNRSSSFHGIFLYAIVFIILIGFRPVHFAFGDTVNYAKTFSNYSQISERITTSRDSLFYLFMWGCSQVMNVNWFFLVVEIMYVVPIVASCWRLYKKNSGIGVVFCFSAFSFFSYSVNGIRNGVALSLVLLALTFIQGNSRDKVVCGILSALAISIHASAALPVVCMLGACFIKKPKFFFNFWALAVLISLVAGNTVTNLFASLGFDERLSDYIHPEIEEDIYTVTGFRWDFLLYSAIPILLGWYAVIKKKVMNSTYLLLLGTYILANAFWIMVIRAEFSNRFAYLSWFLYPIVLAYPLLKLKIWPKTQGRKTAVIMMAHLAFTLFMVFIVG